MPEEYELLVEELKKIGIPFAENAWSTRPDTEHHGVIALEFEAGSLEGDNRKVCRAFQGSVDLYSKIKGGGGYPRKIEKALEAICKSAWRMNQFQWERKEGLFHWEWTFEVME